MSIPAVQYLEVQIWCFSGTTAGNPVLTASRDATDYQKIHVRGKIDSMALIADLSGCQSRKMRLADLLKVAGHVIDAYGPGSRDHLRRLEMVQATDLTRDWRGVGGFRNTCRVQLFLPTVEDVQQLRRNALELGAQTKGTVFMYPNFGAADDLLFTDLAGDSGEVGVAGAAVDAVAGVGKTMMKIPAVQQIATRLLGNVVARVINPAAEKTLP